MAIHGAKREGQSVGATRTNGGGSVRVPVSDEGRKLEGRERAKALALRSLANTGSTAEGLARSLAVSPTQAKRYLHDDGLVPVAAILTALDHDEGREWARAMVRELLVESEGGESMGDALAHLDVASLAAFAVHSSEALSGYAGAIADGYIDRSEAARVIGLLRNVVAKSVEVIERLERPLRTGGEQVLDTATIAKRVETSKGAPRKARRS